MPFLQVHTCVHSQLQLAASLSRQSAPTFFRFILFIIIASFHNISKVAFVPVAV